MIPLIRPQLPTVDQLRSYFETSAAAGIWSNFGPVHEHCIAEIKKFTGGFPVLVSSATAGIGLLTEFMFESESTVVVPDYTHAGSILPIVNRGFHTALIECNEKSRAVDLDIFKDACDDDTGDIVESAVIVNPFGRGIKRKEYAAIARKHGIELVFDYAGAWGDFDIGDEFPTVYSFHATKTLPIGEGGVVIFAEEMEAINFRKFTNFRTDSNRHIARFHGENAKLSEVSCAVLAAQLEPEMQDKIWRRLANRKQLQRIYSNLVREDLTAIDTLHMNLSLCTIMLPKEVDVHDFEIACAQSGFVAKQYYIPLHEMQAFEDLDYYGSAANGLTRCVALPSDATIEEAMEIADKVTDILGRLILSTPKTS